ncbi:MAG: hypothetical protein ACYTF0_02105 [Planctomycetota bacterium]
MATPEQIFTIYQRLFQEAATIRDFQVAKGDKVSGTVNLLLKGDRAKLLDRWGDEMVELGGVLNGTHDDPYIMEATQCFYWASLYAVTGGATWADLEFDQLAAEAAGHSQLTEVNGVLELVARLRTMDPEQVPARKLFLLWRAMDNDYRHNPRFSETWPLDQVMEYDLQDMKKRDYLAPILREVLG